MMCRLLLTALLALLAADCDCGGILVDRDGGLVADAASDGAIADLVAADTGAGDVVGGDAVIADAGFSDGSAADAAPLDARACLGTSCAPGVARCHVCVDVHIDNFCHTSTTPSSIDVPTDTVLTLTFNNRSVDYAADIWSSMGYGFIELPTGDTWQDPIEHCTMSSQYREYFDVSIYGGGSSACPGVQLDIDCR